MQVVKNTANFFQDKDKLHGRPTAVRTLNDLVPQGTEIALQFRKSILGVKSRDRSQDSLELELLFEEQAGGVDQVGQKQAISLFQIALKGQ
jgi:hypothetical protein